MLTKTYNNNLNSKTYNDLKKANGVIVFGTGNLGNIVLAALKKADIKFEVVWISYNF